MRLGDVRRVFELLHELIEAIEEESPVARKRKLATVKEKVLRERHGDSQDFP